MAMGYLLQGDHSMMKKFGAFAGVALVLLVSVSLVSAQQAVSLGDTLQGGLTGEPVTFSIELNAGDVVTITAESTDFDSYVAVSDADGNLIGENDDGGANFGLNSNLTVVAPADGTYTIELRADFGNSQGTYTLRIVGTEATQVTYGSSTEFTAAEEANKFFSFTGAAGDVLDISAVSEQDVQIAITGPDSQVLIEDDDSGLDNDPLVRRLRLPEDGVYGIIISHSWQEVMDENPITLSVEEVDDLVVGPEPVTVKIGIQSDIDVLHFDVEAGQPYTLEIQNHDPEQSFSIDMHFLGDEYTSGELRTYRASRVVMDFTMDQSGTVRLTINNPGWQGETGNTLAISVQPAG